jgi:hypothetical protein
MNAVSDLVLGCMRSACDWTDFSSFLCMEEFMAHLLLLFKLLGQNQISCGRSSHFMRSPFVLTILSLSGSSHRWGSKFADQSVELISLFIPDVQSSFVDDQPNNIRRGRSMLSPTRYITLSPLCHLDSM